MLYGLENAKMEERNATRVVLRCEQDLSFVQEELRNFDERHSVSNGKFAWGAEVDHA